MKKAIAFALTLVMLLGVMVGCGSKNETPPASGDTPTAAGDTLLAEFCYRYFPKRELTEEGMRYAVAAGAAAVTRPGSEPPDPQRVEELAQSVNPVRIR